ncbi:MAG: EscU/YscU/HrcU family type III secretion system export apparatus switch protein [Gammaproteobacteria bacterium]|nr:EscU/YscU/HrcU family type III secretion system export apparatus switch protein [Gammaproteobacteria bacterium]
MKDYRENSRPEFALALDYDGLRAPRLTAKGRGEVARQIVEIAEEFNIPLHQDPELSALLAQIPLGDEIPENLYRAVAEVIAFAYILTGKFPTGYDESSDASEGVSE